MAENCRMQPSTFSGFLYLHHCKNAMPHQKVELKFNFLASCHLRYYLCTTSLSMVFNLKHVCIVIKFSFSKQYIVYSIFFLWTILCVQLLQTGALLRPVPVWRQGRCRPRKYKQTLSWFLHRHAMPLCQAATVPFDLVSRLHCQSTAFPIVKALTRASLHSGLAHFNA